MRSAQSFPWNWAAMGVVAMATMVGSATEAAELKVLSASAGIVWLLDRDRCGRTRPLSGMAKDAAFALYSCV